MTQKAMLFLFLGACSGAADLAPDGEVQLSVSSVQGGAGLRFDLALWAQSAGDPNQFVQTVALVDQSPASLGGSSLETLLPCNGGVTYKVDAAARLTDGSASGADSTAFNCVAGKRTQIELALKLPKRGPGGVAGIGITATTPTVSPTAAIDPASGALTGLAVDDPGLELLLLGAAKGPLALSSFSSGKGTDGPYAIAGWSLPKGGFGTDVLGLALAAADDEEVTSGGYLVRYHYSSDGAGSDTASATIEPAVAGVLCNEHGAALVVTNVLDLAGSFQCNYRLSYSLDATPGKAGHYTDVLYAARDASGKMLDLMAVGTIGGHEKDGVFKFALLLADEDDPGRVSAARCTFDVTTGASCQEDAPGSGYLALTSVAAVLAQP